MNILSRKSHQNVEQVNSLDHRIKKINSKLWDQCKYRLQDFIFDHLSVKFLYNLNNNREQNYSKKQVIYIGILRCYLYLHLQIRVYDNVVGISDFICSNNNKICININYLLIKFLWTLDHSDNFVKQFNNSSNQYSNYNQINIDKFHLNYLKQPLTFTGISILLDRFLFYYCMLLNDNVCLNQEHT